MKAAHMATDTLTPTERIDAAIAELGLTLEYKFVPFSMSRNKDEKHKSLNWVVTLKRGNASFSIDYSAGEAHCPSHKQLWNATAYEKRQQRELLDRECETGKRHRWFESLTTPMPIVHGHAKAILPKAADVIYSLSIESSVLDEPSFEAWADSLGYDKDSRSAEATYRACLDTALKLRAMIGDAGLRLLQDACQDY